jgi:hypothetical protein
MNEFTNYHLTLIESTTKQVNRGKFIEVWMLKSACDSEKKKPPADL